MFQVITYHFVKTYKGNVDITIRNGCDKIYNDSNMWVRDCTIDAANLKC